MLNAANEVAVAAFLEGRLSFLSIAGVIERVLELYVDETLGPAQAGAQRRYDFTADAVGKEPSQFVPMVGNWVVTQDEGRRVLLVDGRIWRKGQPSGGLADKDQFGVDREMRLESSQAGGRSGSGHLEVERIVLRPWVVDIGRAETAQRIKWNRHRPLSCLQTPACLQPVYATARPSESEYCV